jgi:hypothetical protein
LAIIIAKRCCNYCGVTGGGCRRLLDDSSKDGLDKIPTKAIPYYNVRKLKKEEYDVAPVRNTTTGNIIVKSSGGLGSAEASAEVGEDIAKEFYDAVKDILDNKDPCHDILLDSHYKVMLMTVITL